MEAWNLFPWITLSDRPNLQQDRVFWARQLTCKLSLISPDTVNPVLGSRLFEYFKQQRAAIFDCVVNTGQPYCMLPFGAESLFSSNQVVREEAVNVGGTRVPATILVAHALLEAKFGRMVSPQPVVLRNVEIAVPTQETPGTNAVMLGMSAICKSRVVVDSEKRRATLWQASA